MSVVAFAVMACLTIGFAACVMGRELRFLLPVLTQKGDSSLSPQSVNWLGALALIGAILICQI